MSIRHAVTTEHDESRVIMGKLTSPYGVKGWLKVFSHTSPMEGILDYTHWSVEKNGTVKRYKVLQGRRQGKGLVAQLEGVSDRDAAEALSDATILLAKEELPSLEEDEFYWHQLEGLKVVTLDGVVLGQVDHLFETGANDVLVVRGGEGGKEHLLPYLPDQVIQRIDLDAQEMVVDWDPEF